MKMPGNNPTENGFYPFGDTSGFNEDVEVSENGIGNNSGEEFNSVQPYNDFSEYMWMEHMEEFDREVMKRLEEEALMEECIEAMLEDERTNPQSNTSGNNDANNAACLLNNLQLSSAETAKTSTLNPLAAEFVPGKRPSDSAESKDK